MHTCCICVKLSAMLSFNLEILVKLPQPCCHILNRCAWAITAAPSAMVRHTRTCSNQHGAACTCCCMRTTLPCSQASRWCTLVQVWAHGGPVHWAPPALHGFPQGPGCQQPVASFLASRCQEGPPSGETLECHHGTWQCFWPCCTAGDLTCNGTACREYDPPAVGPSSTGGGCTCLLSRLRHVAFLAPLGVP